MLVKWPNDVTPLTINFDVPVSSAGSFVGTGSQGDEATLTIQAFDAEGQLLMTTTSEVDPHADQQNREGFWAIRTGEDNIASVTIRNDNHTDYGNALVVDDLVWGRSADYESEFEQAANEFSAFFNGQGDPVFQPSVEDARVGDYDGDGISEIAVFRPSVVGVSVRPMGPQPTDQSMGIDNEDGPMIESVDGYDGRIAPDSSFMVSSEVAANPNADNLGLVFDFDSPVSSVGSLIAVRNTDAAVEGSTGMSGAMVHVSGLDSGGAVVAEGTFGVDEFAELSSGESYWTLTANDADISQVQLRLVDAETGEVVENSYTIAVDQLTLTAPESTLSCDLDGDGDCDGTDVDLLVENIANGSGDAQFDLNGDGIVNRDDLDQWLVDAGAENIGPGAAYLPGDANLDGLVDISDFNHWNANKFTNSPAWTNGDFNADGQVDISDFNLWNAHKLQQSAGPAASPVGMQTGSGDESPAESRRTDRQERLAAFDQVFASEYGMDYLAS